MDNAINIILVACSIIIGIIGLIFVMRIWLVWKRVDMNVLKARVFLSPEFLKSNLMLIFLAGAFIVLRRFLQLFDLLDHPILNYDLTIIFDLTGVAVVSLFVILAYYWHKLVESAIELKDSRWISKIRFIPVGSR